MQGKSYTRFDPPNLSTRRAFHLRTTRARMFLQGSMTLPGTLWATLTLEMRKTALLDTLCTLLLLANVLLTQKYPLDMQRETQHLHRTSSPVDNRT